MAYVKIINIKSQQHLGSAIDYSENELKTSEHLDNLSDYIDNESKTEERHYVSTFNCDKENTFEDMMATKKYYKKTSGRMGYQIIQSFKPGEIAPELAHEIGCKFSKEYLGNYEVKVATHIDKEHIHNHIIFNSVSLDGKKFHISKHEFHENLRGISDKIIKENGLSIITPKKTITNNYVIEAEKLYKDTGKKSLSTQIVNDIELSIKQSVSIPDFIIEMENRGYVVNDSGKYLKVKHPDGQKFFRLNTLGYTDEILLNKIICPIKSISLATEKYYKAKKTFANKETKHITQIECMYIRWLYVLGNAKKYPHKYKVNYDEVRKFERYKKQLNYVAKNNIATTSQLLKTEQKLIAYKKQLDIEKFVLKGMEKKYIEIFNAHKTYERIKMLKTIDEVQSCELKKSESFLKSKGFDDFNIIADKRKSLACEKLENKKEIDKTKKEIASVMQIKEGLRTVKENILIKNRDMTRQQIDKEEIENGR